MGRRVLIFTYIYDPIIKEHLLLAVSVLYVGKYVPIHTLAFSAVSVTSVVGICVVNGGEQDNPVVNDLQKASFSANEVSMSQIGMAVSSACQMKQMTI